MENLLKRFNYPHTRAHPGCKVSCHGIGSIYIIGPSVIHQGQSDSGAASCYKADRLVASLIGFHSVQSSFAVRKSRAAGEEHCKRGHGWVCANLSCLMLCRSADLRTFGFTMREFSMVGSYTEKNHKTFKFGGWELARVWALARDNTVIALNHTKNY